VNVVETKKFELNSPLIIVGFAGAGLAGGIAVTHIIDQLNMEVIAHVQSRLIPPSVVFLDGKLRQPFRIHATKDGKLCIVVCEIPLHIKNSYQIADSLLDWIESKGVKELVALEGIPVRGIPSKRTVFCAAEFEKIEACKEKGIEMSRAGIISGVIGSILNECLTRKITGVAFLTPVIAFIPDPEGAAMLIDAVNKVYNLDIDTKDLVEKAEEIKQKLKILSKRHEKMRKAEERDGRPEELYI
jgi:uncharacterized protein